MRLNRLILLCRTALLSDKALARLNAMGWRPDAIQQHPLNSKADVDDMFRKGEQAIEAFRAIKGAGAQPAFGMPLTALPQTSCLID